MVFGLSLRWIAVAAVASAMAAPAFAQSAADGQDAIVVATPVPKPKVTRLEANAPVEEVTLPARRRARVADADAPTGIDAGAFRLFPVLETGVVFSSNPAQRTDGDKADAGIYLRPSLKLESDWVRHQLDVSASADLDYFAAQSSADAQSADVSAKLRLDVLRSTTLDLETAYAIDIARDTGDAGSSGFDHDLSQSAALTHRMGKLEARGRAAVRLKTFGETAGTDNSSLDYIEPEVSLRASYDLTPVLKPFAEAGYRPRLYLDRRSAGGLERSSQGVFAGAGWTLDLAPFWSAEASGSYLVRDFDNPGLKTSGSFSARGSVTWRPTDLTTVSLAASTALSDGSGTSTDGDRATTVDLNVSHDVRDNITLKANAGLAADKTQSGTDLTFSLGADTIYRLSPWLALTAAYDFLAFDSAIPNADYTDHSLMVGVELRR